MRHEAKYDRNGASPIANLKIHHSEDILISTLDLK